ncbi:MAG: response regulator transcription factor [Catenulispora sp.]|nr:response regulator transcription factor [Catenulispora sp.]
MAAPVRVVLADDQPLARTSLRMVIADTDDLVVVGEAGTGAEAVRVSEQQAPDVVVMDIRMPGMDGIEATAHITGARDASLDQDAVTRVVVLTTFDDDDNVYAALRAGASGFLVKDMALEEILSAIRTVAAGNALIAPSVTRRLIERFAAGRGPVPTAAASSRLTGLTDRELEVLTLIGKGLSNAEIAKALVLSTGTVKGYVTRLLLKSGARDRVHLVITAYEAGLVTPEWREHGSRRALLHPPDLGR